MKEASLYIALVHHPIRNKRGEMVTTSVTNLDIHDIARSARTFGVKKYFIVTPLEEQKALVKRILGHWEGDVASAYNPDRQDALSFVQLVDCVDEARRAVEREEGESCQLAVTGANFKSYEGGVFDMAQQQKLDKAPYLLLFGTGWGLHETIVSQADFRLTPIFGMAKDGYNHLSVRSAVAIYQQILNKIFVFFSRYPSLDKDFKEFSRRNLLDEILKVKLIVRNQTLTDRAGLSNRTCLNFPSRHLIWCNYEKLQLIKNNPKAQFVLIFHELLGLLKIEDPSPQDLNQLDGYKISKRLAAFVSKVVEYDLRLPKHIPPQPIMAGQRELNLFVDFVEQAYQAKCNRHDINRYEHRCNLITGTCYFKVNCQKDQKNFLVSIEQDDDHKISNTAFKWY